MGTFYPKSESIERDWHVVDLEGETVGRAATRIATLLRGKHKPIFTPHMDVGDYVVVINAAKVAFTGRKRENKLYHKPSRYLGHMKTRTAEEMLDKKPEEIIKLAVRRMLPRSPLGRETMGKLKVYAGNDHPHAGQNPKPFKLA